MGATEARTGTVVWVMAQPDPPARSADDLAEDAADDAPVPAAPPPVRRPRRLDARTVAICVCLALVAALGAGLVASIVLDDDDDTAGEPVAIGSLDPIEREDAAARPSEPLVRAGEIDPAELLAVELTTVDDTPTTLTAFVGEQPVLVNLWAQSCAPCIKEMPWLEETSEANPEVRFVGINVLDRLDRAEAMAARTGITYEWVRDPLGDFGFAARSTGLPDTLLLDNDGAVIASKLGPFASQAEIQQWLDAALG